MEQLNQEEVVGLVRAVQDRMKHREASLKARKVSSFAFGGATRINSQQLSALGLLHQTFAANLTHYLGAYLRFSVEVNFGSVEAVSYADFLKHLSEPTYCASVRLQPPEAVAVLNFDLPLAFPIIDLLLGGEGKAEPVARDITEIEEQILETVMKIICQELQSTWQPLLDMKFRFDRKQQHEQIMRLMPPTERILTFSFDVKMPEIQGKLVMAFPSTVSGKLLRKISEQWSTQRPHISPEDSARVRDRLQNCAFSVDVRLPETAVRGCDLLTLEVGQTLVLQHRVAEPVLMYVANKNLFTVYPIRVGNVRGAVVDKRLRVAIASEKGLP